MSCNHDTLTDITVENKYVLIYCGDILIQGRLVIGGVLSAHTVELFDDVQGLVNRAEALGIQCTDLHILIKILEHGGTLPPDHMQYLLNNVWDDDIGYQQRMEALGYSRPIQ